MDAIRPAMAGQSIKHCEPHSSVTRHCWQGCRPRKSHDCWVGPMFAVLTHTHAVSRLTQLQTSMVSTCVYTPEVATLVFETHCHNVSRALKVVFWKCHTVHMMCTFAAAGFKTLQLATSGLISYSKDFGIASPGRNRVLHPVSSFAHFAIGRY